MNFVTLNWSERVAPTLERTQFGVDTCNSILGCLLYAVRGMRRVVLCRSGDLPCSLPPSQGRCPDGTREDFGTLALYSYEVG